MMSIKYTEGVAFKKFLCHAREYWEIIRKRTNFLKVNYAEIMEMTCFEVRTKNNSCNIL